VSYMQKIRWPDIAGERDSEDGSPGFSQISSEMDMKFTERTVEDAWLRSRGRCECMETSHAHRGRCGRPLIWEQREASSQPGAWAPVERDKSIPKWWEAVGHCRIICQDCLLLSTKRDESQSMPPEGGFKKLCALLRGRIVPVQPGHLRPFGMRAIEMRRVAVVLSTVLLVIFGVKVFWISPVHVENPAPEGPTVLAAQPSPSSQLPDRIERPELRAPEVEANLSTAKHLRRGAGKHVVQVRGSGVSHLATSQPTEGQAVIAESSKPPPLADLPAGESAQPPIPSDPEHMAGQSAPFASPTPESSLDRDAAARGTRLAYRTGPWAEYDGWQAVAPDPPYAR
jgi:hypothetical protein